MAAMDEDGVMRSLTGANSAAFLLQYISLWIEENVRRKFTWTQWTAHVGVESRRVIAIPGHVRSSA